VHFAVGPDVVWLTIRLDGNKTLFLPINKGNGTGAGNPENPHGYKTAYPTRRPPCWPADERPGFGRG
jgi:type I restriction enzyme R subunit